MIQKKIRIIPGSALLWLMMSVPQMWGFQNPKMFAFVSSSYIITAELATEHTFVVNFVNLSDFVIVVQPVDFIYRGASGRYYAGQVYELEHADTKGEMQRYSASILLREHSFAGLNVVGLFKEQDQIEELSVRIGSQRFYMEPLEKIQFEQLARKIETLDLDSADVTEMFRDANIRLTGSVKTTDGTDEWDRDWEGLVTSDGVNPPKAIESPAILLPENAKTSEDKRKVRISCLITKNGGIQNLKVVKSRDRNLEQRALDSVANSWVFLPAAKNGEIYETVIEFEVELVDPPEK
ncbi:MAG: energy transducer TonB [Acidobacteria bacterium]|nr:energy transducer TonB [Acidobacteriota bacterium]